MGYRKEGFSGRQGIIILFDPGNINLSYCAVDSPSVPLKPTIRFHYANNAGR